MLLVFLITISIVNIVQIPFLFVVAVAISLISELGLEIRDLKLFYLSRYFHNIHINSIRFDRSVIMRISKWKCTYLYAYFAHNWWGWFLLVHCNIVHWFYFSYKTVIHIFLPVFFEYKQDSITKKYNESGQILRIVSSIPRVLFLRVSECITIALPICTQLGFVSLVLFNTGFKTHQ